MAGPFEAKADLVADHMKSDKVTFDITVVAAIISILYTLFKAFQECKSKPKTVLDIIQNPNKVQRRRLRRIIARHVKDDAMQMSVFEGLIGTTGDYNVGDVEEMLAGATKG